MGALIDMFDNPTEFFVGDSGINLLVQKLRDEETRSPEFRTIAETLGTLLAYKMVQNYPTMRSGIKTPMNDHSFADVPITQPYLVELERGGHMLLSGAW